MIGILSPDEHMGQMRQISPFPLIEATVTAVLICEMVEGYGPI